MTKIVVVGGGIARLLSQKAAAPFHRVLTAGSLLIKTKLIFVNRLFMHRVRAILLLFS